MEATAVGDSVRHIIEAMSVDWHTMQLLRAATTNTWVLGVCATSASQWLAAVMGPIAKYLVVIDRIALYALKEPHIVAVRGSQTCNHNPSHVQAMYQPCLLP
jgi:hypothetical protein